MFDDDDIALLFLPFLALFIVWILIALKGVFFGYQIEHTHDHED